MTTVFLAALGFVFVWVGGFLHGRASLRNRVDALEAAVRRAAGEVVTEDVADA